MTIETENCIINDKNFFVFLKECCEAMRNSWHQICPAKDDWYCPAYWWYEAETWACRASAGKSVILVILGIRFVVIIFYNTSLLTFQEIQSLLYGWIGPDLTTYGELCAEGTFR